MEITAAISAARVQPLPAASPTAGGAKAAAEDAKLKESCKQFEAIIWRSVLEKSSASMMGGEDSNCDKTGTYQYFVNNNLANAVTGLPSSFSSVLYSQLSSHLKTGPGQNNPS